MNEIDLDLQTAEEELEEDFGEKADGESDDEGSEVDDGSEQIVLGILDGSTPDEEWIAEVEDEKTLVLSVEGDVNELAAGFARDVRDAGGDLMHFRGFLVVTPPGVRIDNSRLGD